MKCSWQNLFSLDWDWYKIPIIIRCKRCSVVWSVSRRLLSPNVVLIKIPARCSLLSRVAGDCDQVVNLILPAGESLVMNVIKLIRTSQLHSIKPHHMAVIRWDGDAVLSLRSSPGYWRHWTGESQFSQFPICLLREVYCALYCAMYCAVLWGDTRWRVTTQYEGWTLDICNLLSSLGTITNTFFSILSVLVLCNFWWL